MTSIRREPTFSPTAAQRPAASPEAALAHRQPGSIMPKRTVAGRSLALVVILMCYLACLALAGVLIITQAVAVWSADISREITVQIRPVEGTDLEGEVAKAAELLKQTPGVTGIRVIDQSQAAKLLEPWLGDMPLISELPIPRMIAVETDQRAPPDLASLKQSLESSVVGAALDTHRQWEAQLGRTANTLRWIGYGVLAIISLATAAVIVFATRAAINSNRSVVEVLHLVGARDRFIARQVEGHFIKLAFRSGVIGTAAGVLSVVVLAFMGPSDVPGGLTDASRSLMFGSTTLGWMSYGLLLLVPVVATVISLVTARFTVMRILSGVL
ncbi:cell division transport system permease protein [Rhodoligotrophos appendicifer]|uniref:cell division protein FtsX n=1 Tax=Rhodoligotrophos appendicifer TaxID=987056 RepID=UPI001186BB2E|nr:FtsX-like permease family protein [Rhodoligotrophos appendicifer]